MEEMLKKVKDNWGLVIPFVTCLILLRLSPMMYDGWYGSSYYYNEGGVINWIRYVLIFERNNLNGRVGSNLICGIVESIKSEWIVDIVGTLILVLILYFTLRLFEIKRTGVSGILYTALIILIPYRVREYVVQIALMQYVMPVLFFTIALDIHKKYEEDKSYKWFVLLFPLTVMACTWMENSAVAYGFVMFILFVKDWYDNKRVDSKLLFNILLGAISGLYMITSPGIAKNRIGEAGVHSALLSFSFINSHIKSFFWSYIYCGAMENIVLALCFVIAIVTANRLRKNKMRYFIFLCANILVLIVFFLLGLCTNEYIYTSEINSHIYDRIISINDAIVPIMALVYFLWIAFNLYLDCDNSNIWSVSLGLIYSLMCVIIVFTTNQVGDRIYSPFLFIVIILSVAKCAKNLNKNKIGIFEKALLFFVVVLAMDYEVQLYQRLYYTGLEREEKIAWIREKQFLNDEKSDYYILPSYCERDAFLGGKTTVGTFHYPQFLWRYGLDEDTLIYFSGFDPAEYIYAKKNVDNSIECIVLESQDGDYTYDFTVYYKADEDAENSIIASKEDVGKEKWIFRPQNGKGIYSFSVVKHDLKQGTDYEIDQRPEVKVE